MRPLAYKFVELSIVTDETIEEVVNLWVGKGWIFDGIRFVTSEASRRPQMAFVSFTREGAPDVEPSGPRPPPRLVKPDDDR
ncbi:MAG TPA: hypothetical protein VIV58_34750 [Kofleriaceae bacterium]